MSHEATLWAIKQRGIKPAAKVVLWQLCDRYHPDHGCFPSLDTLSDDCEMSRRSVQDQIEMLQKAGLIRVEKMPRKNGQLPRNRYRFQFEEAADNLGQDLPKADFALGKNEREPWANSSECLGQNLPTNLVREPLNEPVKDDDDGVREVDDFRGRILEALGLDPEARTALGGPADMAEARRWLELPHVTKDRVCEQIRAVMARKGEGLPSTLAYFTDEMRRMSTRLEASAASLAPAPRRQSSRGEAVPMAARAGEVDLDALADLWAPKITGGVFVPPSAISPALARHMLDTGRVTQAELRRAGVSV